jgi:hypothetical protein
VRNARSVFYRIELLTSGFYFIFLTMRQPQSGVVMATDLQRHTQARIDEQTPHSPEDSMELLLQALGQSSITVDQNTILTSATLITHDLHQPSVVDGPSQHQGRLISSHWLSGV